MVNLILLLFDVHVLFRVHLVCILQCDHTFEVMCHILLIQIGSYENEE